MLAALPLGGKNTVFSGKIDRFPCCATPMRSFCNIIYSAETNIWLFEYSFVIEIFEYKNQYSIVDTQFHSRHSISQCGKGLHFG